MKHDECDFCQEVSGVCTECEGCFGAHCHCDPCQHGKSRNAECVFCVRMIAEPESIDDLFPRQEKHIC